MNAKESLRILIIASDHGLANPLISALRQDALRVSATSLNKPAEFARQLKLEQPHLLLLIQSTARDVEQCLITYASAKAKTPLLLACENCAMPGKHANYHENIRDVLPLQDTPRLVRSIKKQATFYREVMRNRKLATQIFTLEKQQQVLLDNNLNGIAMLKQGLHLYCNNRYARIFSCQDKKHLLNTSLFDLLETQSKNRLEKFLSNGADSAAPILIKTKTAQEMLSLSFSSGFYKRESCLQVTVKLAKGNDHYSNEKHSLANQDLLTRLENIEHFTTRIESAIAQAISRQIFSALLIVHIDQFSQVQEKIGKSGTNQLLYEISEFLKSAINTPFTASRLAENEFGLLLYDSDPDQATKLAEFLHERLNSAHSGKAKEAIHLCASLGMVVINDLALDAEDMINRARLNRIIDVPCAQGRRAFSPASDRNKTNQQTPEQIRYALKNNPPTLLFQPLVPFQTDTLERYEVLTRLCGEHNKELMPAEFLSQANIHNLAEELDQQVITRLFQKLNLEQHNNLQLYIHISSNTLVSSRLLSWLSKALQDYRIPAQQLVFQISEIDLHSNWQQALSFCQSLDELGVRKSITRFGSAMEPLSVLTAIKPDSIRLDAILTRDLLYNRQQRKISKLVRAIHHKKAKVCVSGIEDISLLPLLWDLGVDLFQGYSIQVPTKELIYDFPKEQII